LTLKMFLLAILSGSFALGPAIFAAMEYLEVGQNLAPKWKRLAVAGLAGLFGVSAWAMALWLGYIEQPVVFTPEYIVSNVWSAGVMTALSAFTSATLIHGQVALNHSQRGL
jgi:hypothetical protein